MFNRGALIVHTPSLEMTQERQDLKSHGPSGGLGLPTAAMRMNELGNHMYQGICCVYWRREAAHDAEQ